MKRQILTGIACGLAAGLVDLIPMIIQKLPWTANLSALTLWIITGFFIATSQLAINSILKGALIAVLCFLPSSFIIGQDDPIQLVPILCITTILGGLSGLLIQKLSKRFQTGSQS
jgi:CHASE2 domain-containing sensor protein